MDFASGLANLEQAAANSQNRRRGRGSSEGGGEDNRRYQPRPRHHDNNNSNHHRRGGGGHHDNNHYNNRHHHHHNNNRHHHHHHQDRALDGLTRYGYRFPRGGQYRRTSPVQIPTTAASGNNKATDSTPTSSNRKQPLHICLLAITIDDLPYEHIWKAWASSSSVGSSSSSSSSIHSKNFNYKVSLLCHAKFPDRVKSPWLKQRLLLQPRRIVRGNSLSEPEFLCYKPAWGSVEITRAMIDLLHQGMAVGQRESSSTTKPRGDSRERGGRDRDRDRDRGRHHSSSNKDSGTESGDPRFSPNRFFLGDNSNEDDDSNDGTTPPPVDKFVFISETCLPVTTLEECMESLFVIEDEATSDGPRWEPPQRKSWEPPPGKEDLTPTKPTPEKKGNTAEGQGGEQKKDDDKAGSKKEEDGEQKKEGEAEEQVELDWDGNPVVKETPKKEEESNTATTPKSNITTTPIDPADLPINRVRKDSNNNNNNNESKKKIMYLDTSWVNARNFNSPNTPQNKYERDQFNNIHRVVPKRYRWKADQWMALSRPHAKSILDIDRYSHTKILPKDQLWNSFKRINASDEMYFPTALSLVGVLVDDQHNHNHRNNNSNASSFPTSNTNEASAADGTTTAATTPAATPTPTTPATATSSDNTSSSSSPWLERRRVTYTDWSMGMRNPSSFTKGKQDFANIARTARKQGTLFARKFCPFLEIPGQDSTSIERTGDITVEEWQSELQTIVQQEKEGKGQENEQQEEGGGTNDDGGGEDDNNEKDEDNDGGDDEEKNQEDGDADDKEAEEEKPAEEAN